MASVEAQARRGTQTDRAYAATLAWQIRSVVALVRDGPPNGRHFLGGIVVAPTPTHIPTQCLARLLVKLRPPCTPKFGPCGPTLWTLWASPLDGCRPCAPTGIGPEGGQKLTTHARRNSDRFGNSSYARRAVEERQSLSRIGK